MPREKANCGQPISLGGKLINVSFSKNPLSVMIRILFLVQKWCCSIKSTTLSALERHLSRNSVRFPQGRIGDDPINMPLVCGQISALFYLTTLSWPGKRFTDIAFTEAGFQACSRRLEVIHHLQSQNGWGLHVILVDLAIL